MPTDSTIGYYELNSGEFFKSTVAVDMTELRTRFLVHLPPGALILDAGCGSGRDAKAFIDAGCRVDAFDASPSLAALASQHLGQLVSVRTFADVVEQSRYDGIWACASLLHLPSTEIPSAIERLWAALKPGGTLYFSFKQGSGEREHQGRHFTDADVDTAQQWLESLPDLAGKELWTTADQRPERTERWLNVLVFRHHAAYEKLVTGGDNSFLPHLCAAIRQADEIDIAVAFTNETGLRLLLPDLHEALSIELKGAHVLPRIRFLTSDYLNVTDPGALRLLLLLQQKGAFIRVFQAQANRQSFHLKAYLFTRFDGPDAWVGTAYVGSSNISRQALQDGLEWNYRVNFPEDRGFIETRNRFEQLFAHPNTVTLTDAWIEAYEARRVPPPLPIAPGSDEQEAPPQPSVVQIAALDALRKTRDEGFQRGLVVLATGLGKTWLAAFDAQAIGARRVLFVAHREEILQQAAATFLRIRPKARTGFYMGQIRDVEVDVLCASVQTLSRADHLERFSTQHFDYIVIDEFHHAAAATYRRVINYFSPHFLLGLTATPDRTDQSDILSLCDDNLVFSQDLVAGINAELLAPFHYFGIFDREVDYQAIPWRNGKFDPEALSNKLATLARCQHVHEEWKRRAQSRTVAFCISVRHAEFMAEQFVQVGIPAAAVYAGSPLSRAESLLKLRDKQLSVLFTVDLFNEGIDLPEIDTVMMLRPTESKILFLQQLGRGLRKSAGKERLVVLDFVGNHQSFLHKPQALFGIPANFQSLANFARKVELGQFELPKACYVNYDLSLIEFLKSLDGKGSVKDYEALKQTLGHRPSLVEFHRAGASVADVRRQFGSWFELVKEMGDLEPSEAKVLVDHADFLREIETTAMTRCFKMVLLEALSEVDAWRQPAALSVMAEKSWQILQRRRPLLADLPEEVQQLRRGSDPAWLAYWRKNPVNAWVGGNRRAGARCFFSVADECLVPAFRVEAGSVDAFESLVQELVDFRLSTYEARRVDAEGTKEPNAAVPPQPQRVKIPYFQNLAMACAHFTSGRADAEDSLSLGRRYGPPDPLRHFIVRAAGDSLGANEPAIRDGDYLLFEWIAPEWAGSALGNVLVIERQNASEGMQYLLRTVSDGGDGQSLLKAHPSDKENVVADDSMRPVACLKAIVDALAFSIGQRFMREEIPSFFGAKFNPGNWNSGHVVLDHGKVHLLLVTINKQGKAADHRYADYWIDDHTFHWQSQNQTGPADSRGRSLIEHVALGISIHLFVRETKLVAGKAAPFLYCGDVRYVSHSGSKPMSVVFDVVDG